MLSNVGTQAAAILMQGSTQSRLNESIPRVVLDSAPQATNHLLRRITNSPLHGNDTYDRPLAGQTVTLRFRLRDADICGVPPTG